MRPSVNIPLYPGVRFSDRRNSGKFTDGDSENRCGRVFYREPGLDIAPKIAFLSRLLHLRRYLHKSYAKTLFKNVLDDFLNRLHDLLESRARFFSRLGRFGAAFKAWGLGSGDPSPTSWVAVKVLQPLAV
jgi:hypothetical protein